MKRTTSSSTPPRRIRLKACVDRGDQTAEFIPFEVISTAILTYFYLLLDTNIRILVSLINMRFRPDTTSKHCNLSVHEWITRSRARDPDLLTQHKVSKTCLLEGDR